MNGKKIACVLLMFILAGIAYSSQMLQKRAAAMLDEANQSELAAESAKGDRNRVAIELKRLEYETKDLRDFLVKWTPVIHRIQSAQDAEQIIMGVVRNSGILILSQKFEVKENRQNTLVPKIMQGTLVVQDEYAKSMTWLGELERKLPLARLTTCRLKQGDTSRQVNLEVHFDIPMINLEAETAKK